MYFWGWVCCAAAQMWSLEGGCDTDVGRYSSFELNSRILIENPLATIANWKFSTKSAFVEFTSMETFTQLLSIERIQQSQKFYYITYSQNIYRIGSGQKNKKKL